MKPGDDERKEPPEPERPGVQPGTRAGEPKHGPGILPGTLAEERQRPSGPEE